MRSEITGGDRPNQARWSRRELMAGAAGGAGVIAAQALLSAAPAQATQGSPVLLGQDNTGATAATGLVNTSGQSAVLADPGNNVAVAGDSGLGTGVQGTGIFGVHGLGLGGGTGVQGTGGPNDGFGVVGQGAGGGSGVAGAGGANNGTGVAGTGGGAGYGVFGSGGSKDGVGVFGLGQGVGDGVQGLSPTGNGVHGYTTTASGVGVLAENPAGTALKAVGATVFSRSGVITVAEGKSKVTKTGAMLTTASLVLATAQQNVAGVWVESAVPDVADNSFTVHLNKSAPVSLTVAWFIVN